MAADTRVGTEDSPIQVLFDAVVRSPIAPMHAEPHIDSPMISQQLSGHRVEVVDEEGDWVRARGADEYEGWMHLGFLARTPHATRAPEPAISPRLARLHHTHARPATAARFPCAPFSRPRRR